MMVCDMLCGSHPFSSIYTVYCRYTCMTHQHRNLHSTACKQVKVAKGRRICHESGASGICMAFECYPDIHSG